MSVNIQMQHQFFTMIQFSTFNYTTFLYRILKLILVRFIKINWYAMSLCHVPTKNEHKHPNFYLGRHTLNQKYNKINVREYISSHLVYSSASSTFLSEKETSKPIIDNNNIIFLKGQKQIFPHDENRVNCAAPSSENCIEK